MLLVDIENYMELLFRKVKFVIFFVLSSRGVCNVWIKVLNEKVFV